jgi:Protein of unknown function (DUF2934)
MELEARPSIDRRPVSTPSRHKRGAHVGETFMAKPSEKEIAARAYKLWEQNGQPEGREEEFWRLAEQELLNEDKSSPLRTPDTL